MMKRAYVLAASFLALVSAVTYGGGVHSHAKVVGVEAKGDDVFSVVLEQVGQESLPFFKTGEPITVHLRYSQPAESSMTKAHYLRGINLLLAHYRSGEVLEVGFGNFPAPVRSESNEVQAIGLFMVEHGALHFMFEE